MSNHAGRGVADGGFRLVLRLAVGDQRHTEGMDVVARPVGLCDGQMVGVEVHPDGASLLVRNQRHVHHVCGGEHPPAFAVPLETVADGLPQAGGASGLLSMFPTVTGVLCIAVQGRQRVFMAVGEPHALDHQVLSVLSCQAIRHPQSQGQRPIISHCGHA